MQLESGVSVTRDHVAIDGAGRVEFTTLELPNALLRAGLTRRLELRAAMIGWIRSTSDRAFADPASVLSTVDLAAEYQVAAQEGLGVDLAVIAGVSVPTQDFGSGDNTLDPFAQFVWSRDLTDTVNLGGMAAWSLPHRPATAWRPSPAASCSAIRWAGPGARSGRRSAAIRTPRTTRWRGPATSACWWPRTRRQLDGFVGHGFNDRAADWAVGVGLTVRWR